MIEPNFIIRTNRRSMSITISKEGQVIVRAPKKLSMDKIFEFVREKQKWITKHLNTIKQNQFVNFEIKNFDAVLIFGKQYSIRQIEGVKKIELTSNEIIYPITWNKEQFIRKIKLFLKKQANYILKERIEYFANLMQLNYSVFSVKDYKARWGCCSRTGEIIINYKSIMLPHNIIDYILIHELSHLIEFNHSNKFYKIIESIMPQWKNIRKQLKKYDFLLTL